jgi:hypothetical protein
MSDEPKTPESKAQEFTHITFLCDAVEYEELEDGDERDPQVIDQYKHIVVLPLAHTAFSFDKKGVCTAVLIGTNSASNIHKGTKLKLLTAEDVLTHLKKFI